MATKLVSSLITSIRNRGEIRSAYISDTEMLGYINALYSSLYDEVVHANNDYFVSSQEYTLNASSTYTLPTDFLKCIAAVYHKSSNDRYALKMVPARERYQRENTSSTTLCGYTNLTYDIRGSNLYIYPTTATGTLTLEYIPQITLPDEVTDSISLDNNDWFEYIIWGVIAICRHKEAMDTTVAIGLKEQALQRIIGHITRDSGTPVTVSNVYRNYYHNDLY